MRKVIVTAAAAAIAASTFGLPKAAEARNGGAIAAGVIGGLAAGAIIGGAAQGGYYGGSGYGYYGGPAYGYSTGYYAAPAYGYSNGYAGCYIQRQRVWTDYGWRIRRVRICD